MPKKIFIFLTSVILIFFSVQVSLAGEGDVVWEKKENFTTDTDLAFGVAVDSTGVYVVGGEEAAYIWRVEKRNLNTGDIIWQKAEDITTDNDNAMKVAVDSTGIYVVGYQDYEVWRVEKRNLNTGDIIWEKTVDGFGLDIPETVAIDSTGVYIAGSQRNWNVWRVEKRNLNTGDIIWQKAEDLTTGTDIAQGVAVDSSGLYVVGSQYIETRWRVEKRNLNTGDIIWQKAEDLTTGTDIAQGVAVDSSGLYVVGSQNNRNKWRVEKRNLNTGDIIWDNVSEPDITGGEDIARAVGVNSSCGVYVVGSQNDSNIWRVENRNLNGGSLMWEKTLDEPGRDFPSEADFYGTSLYVVGTQDDADIWRVERRSYCLCRSHNIYGYAWSENIGWLSMSCDSSGSEHWMLVDDPVFNVLNMTGSDFEETSVYNNSSNLQRDFYKIEDPPLEYTSNITSVEVWVVFFRPSGSPIGTGVIPYISVGSQEWTGSKIPGSPDYWITSYRAFPYKSPFNYWTWDDIRNMEVGIGIEDGVQVTRVSVRVISFDNPNLILRPNGVGKITEIESPLQTVAPPNYGVDIDETNGLFSGYAWSENIGWIRFNPPASDGYPAIGPDYSACLNFPASISVSEPCNSEPELTISGWARACAVFNDGFCEGAANLRPASERGGWDGWIRLRGTWSNPVSLDTGISPAEFRGWAWGGDDNDNEAVIGWISFNRSNTGATSDYKVMTDLVINSAPSVAGLQRFLPNYCLLNPAVTFQWTYQDADGDPQSQYNLQIRNAVGTLVVDNIVNQVVPAGGTGTAGVNVRQTPGPNEIGYGDTYSWQVRVRSNTGDPNWSSFESGPGFGTPVAPYPTPEFDWNPVSPSAGEDVQFDASPTDCGAGGCISYNWDFGDGIGTDTGLNPSYTFTAAGSYTVTLIAANAAGPCPAFHAVNVEVALPRPKWREVAPTF